MGVSVSAPSLGRLALLLVATALTAAPVGVVGWSEDGAKPAGAAGGVFEATPAAYMAKKSWMCVSLA